MRNAYSNLIITPIYKFRGPTSNSQACTLYDDQDTQQSYSTGICSTVI